METANAAALRAGIQSVRDGLSDIDVASMGDRDRIRLLAELTEFTAVVAAGQARLTVAYADSQRALGATVRGISAEVAMARRVGLSRASDLLARSRVLVEDLPGTMDLLASGALNEERAHIVADRVCGLDPIAREVVDEAIAGHLAALSDREVRDCVDRAVMQVDPKEVERRRATAHAKRHVSVRSLGDGMADLVVRCSLVDAASAIETLRRDADARLAVRPATAGFDATPGSGAATDLERTREQVMADAAIAWLTGREVNEGPPVEIQLVLPATGFFRDPETGSRDEAPGHVLGIGPIPASAARELIGRDARTGVDGSADVRLLTDRRAQARLIDREASRVTVRRVWTTSDGRDLVGVESGRWVLPEEVRWALREGGGPSKAHPPDPIGSPYSSDPPGPSTPRDPSTWSADWLGDLARPPRPGELVDLESTDRCYRGLLRRFVVLRDQCCRAPWCGAPIRHIDHARPHRDRPETTAAGGIGACVGHNHAKESPGHRVTVDASSGPAATTHTITWQTPTGRRRRSTAPPVLGWGWTRSAATARSAVDVASPLEVHLAALTHAA